MIFYTQNRTQKTQPNKKQRGHVAVLSPVPMLVCTLEADFSLFMCFVYV